MYEDVIKKFSTPTYLYDINILKDRINYIKSKLDKSYELVFAIKANTFVIPFIDEFIDGYEICSYGEARICNKLNIDYKKYVVSGVNKDYEFISDLINRGVTKFTIESLNQYYLLDKITKETNKKIDTLIRLTSNNQFGVTEEDAKRIITINKDNTLINIKGLEYFSGTQKHSIKKINKEIEYLIEVTEMLENEFKINFEEIEYGPGAPVFYFQGEEFDEDTYFDELNKALNKIKNKKIKIELGRSIVASCGYYLTSVVDLKENKYGNNVILDGGMNHLVYYGQTMAMRVPYFELNQKEKKDTKSYNLYGSLCTINDIIIKSVEVPELQIGDTFVFKNVGAYSSTEGISLFLSRDLPKIVVKDLNNQYHLVRDTIKTSEINFPKI